MAIDKTQGLIFSEVESTGIISQRITNLSLAPPAVPGWVMTQNNFNQDGRGMLYFRGVAILKLDDLDSERLARIIERRKRPVDIDDIITAIMLDGTLEVE